MCLVGNKRAEIARVVPCENKFCTKYAHHLHFCGLQKLNTLNLRHFHPPLNPCNHFSTVLIKTNWYTISCKYLQCRNLESVKIPNTVTSIKHRAFQYCRNLESIIIPSSVNSIGISAFSECKALKDIYCQAVNVPETHSSAFDNSPIENMTLYVPGESMNAYKTTDPWSGFGKFQTLTTGIEKTETAAKPMITSADGQISVSGLSGNATIQVLSLDGKLLDSTSATDGIATLNVQPGKVVIVKVGTESYKVVVK